MCVCVWVCECVSVLFMLIFFPSRLWKRRRFCRRHLPGRRRWLGRQRRFLFLLFPNPPPSLSLPPSPSNFTFLLLFPLTAGAALWRPQRHLLPPGIATGSGGLTLLRAYFAESATRERWRSGLRAPALPRFCPGSAPVLPHRRRGLSQFNLIALRF